MNSKSKYPEWRYCKKWNFIRSAAPHEQYGCKLIKKQLNLLPYGGRTIIAGTPTAAAISLNNKGYVGKILRDNYDVFVTAKDTSNNNVELWIGNAVSSKERTEERVRQWRFNEGVTKKIKIRVFRIDAPELEKQIETECINGNLVKLVLMTSGVYKGTGGKRYDKNNNILDLNFKDSFEKLSIKYPNLHLIVMVLNHPGFKVIYLNKGITSEVI